MARTLRSKPALQLLNRILNSPVPVLHRSTRPIETLAFEEVKTSPEKPHSFTAFVLHGLLGSGRNWRSFSRFLLSSLPSDWRMVLVDLRNHGNSAELEGLNPPHDMVNAAKDLADLVKSQGWACPDVVIGHSMGGKVALQFADSCARGEFGQLIQLPKQLWILDSVPGKVDRENSDGEVEKVLETLKGLPPAVPSRKLCQASVSASAIKHEDSFRTLVGTKDIRRCLFLGGWWIT
ncbi:unnamed protein product [Ilex paraguariensis]|uniref:AB hydrolase-1 domain-containing protein n=1 Tax=Ilex paraguariensis TaxID=185542 RepID=A0ABC8TZH0_9AQUA